MQFHPVLILLMLMLVGLLAMSIGYRPERSSVGQLRATLTTLRRLARRNPDRYGPALALHMRLLAIELFESGRPVQALVSAMTAVDLLRALTGKDPNRFEPELREAVALEDVLKESVGIDASTDLLALAEAEEEALAKAAVAPGAEGDAVAPERPRRPWSAFAWQIALFVWILSVIGLLTAALMAA